MPWFTSRISLTGEYTAGGAGIRGRVWGGTRGLKALRFLRLRRPWRAALPRFWMTSFRTEAVLGVRAIETVAESGRGAGARRPLHSQRDAGATKESSSNVSLGG